MALNFGKLYKKLQESSSLAPSVVLNALTKGIAKKLGAESFTAQDGGDESARKEPGDHVSVFCLML